VAALEAWIVAVVGMFARGGARGACAPGLDLTS
jgi:hypothetical protein